RPCSSLFLLPHSVTAEISSLSLHDALPICAQYERDVLPGELIIINEQGIHSETLTPDPSRNLCAMEYVYFSRPDSNLGGINVHRSEEHTSELQSREKLVCRLLLEKKKEQTR